MENGRCGNDLLHVHGKEDVLRLFKSGVLNLHTGCEKGHKIKVFVKIFYSNFDGQVHIYTDPDETVLYGCLNPLKCRVSLDETCGRMIYITKRDPDQNKPERRITLVAKDETEAISWVEALNYRPINFVNTPVVSPSMFKRLME